MGNVPQSHPNRAEVAEQTVRAYDLKLRGWNYRRIAEELGVSVGTVSNRIQQAIAERVDPRVEEYRAIELDKLENAEERLWQQVAEGTAGRLPRVVEVLMKVSERRSKLLGLDAPDRQQIEATIDSRPTELIAKIQAAREAVARREAELHEI